MKNLFSLALLLGVAAIATGSARAQNKPVTPGVAVTEIPTEIAVCTLQNGGGLVKTAGQEPLEVQYSQGFARFLSEHLSGPQYRVTQRKRPKGLRPGALFLNGELWKIGGIDGKGSSYACNLRLNRVGASKKPELVNSWSGFAQNYRWLSTNLANHPDWHREGLLGALGVQILAQIRACRAEESAQRAQVAAQRVAQITAQTLPADIQISGNAASKITLQSPHGGQLYVFESQNGRPGRAINDGQSWEVEAGKPLAFDLGALNLGAAPRKPPSLLFLLRRNPSGTRGIETDSAQSPGIAPLLDKEKMDELRRQIAPEGGEWVASSTGATSPNSATSPNGTASPNSATSPNSNTSTISGRQTDSSREMVGPPPIAVLQHAPLTVSAPIFPEGSEGWIGVEWVWK